MSDVDSQAIQPSTIANELNPLVQPEYLDVLEESFRNRLGDTLSTWREEQTELGHRAERLGALVLGGATQLAERGRGVVWLLPTLFDEALEHSVTNGWNGYQTAGAAGAAVGVGYMACAYTIGRSLRYAMNKFPKTTKAVDDNHPVMVGVIGQAIDGFPAREELEAAEPEKPEEGYTVGSYDTETTLLGKIKLALVRGPKTALIFGPTPHAGIAQVSEHSEESSEKRLRVISAEGSVFLGALAVGVSALVTNDAFGWAEEIRSAVTNKVYLGIAQVAFISWAVVDNYFARKRFVKKEAN